MRARRFWLVANIATPLLAVVVIAGIVAGVGTVQQAVANDRQRQLVLLEVTAEGAASVLPSATTLATLAQGAADEPPEVQTGSPDTVIASSVEPSACAPVWLGVAVPSLEIERWARSSVDGVILGVASRAEVYPDRATASGVFTILDELWQDCSEVTLQTIETPAERTEELVARPTTTDGGVPGYGVDRRTTFESNVDAELQGWLAVSRYYLAGDAIFELTYWYDAATGAPAWVTQEVDWFESRIINLLATN